MSKLFFLLLTLAAFTSCAKKYKIEGVSSVASLDGKMLFLKAITGNNLVNIDSAEVVHGKFSMKGKIDSVEMAMLYMDDESIMPLVVENGDIFISITNSEQKVSGTPLNNKLYTFIDKKNSLEMKMEDIQKKEAKMIMNGEDPMAIQMQLVREADALGKQMEDHVEEFIVNNSNNVLGPCIFIMLCNSFPHPVITPQIDEIIRKTSESFKSNRLVRDYLGKAKENMQIRHEDPAHPPVGY